VDVIELKSEAEILHYIRALVRKWLQIEHAGAIGS